MPFAHVEALESLAVEYLRKVFILEEAEQFINSGIPQSRAASLKGSEDELLNTLGQYEPTTVAIQACYSSPPWSRAIQKLGHTVKLILPIKVTPFS